MSCGPKVTYFLEREEHPKKVVTFGPPRREYWYVLGIWDERIVPGWLSSEVGNHLSDKLIQARVEGLYRTCLVCQHRLNPFALAQRGYKYQDDQGAASSIWVAVLVLAGSDGERRQFSYIYIYSIAQQKASYRCVRLAIFRLPQPFFRDIRFGKMMLSCELWRGVIWVLAACHHMLRIALSFSPHRLMALGVPVSLGHECVEARANKSRLYVRSPI